MDIDLYGLELRYEELPDPVHVMVLQRLSINDRLRMASVSKRWHGNVNLANLRQADLTIKTNPGYHPNLLDFGLNTRLVVKFRSLDDIGVVVKSTFPNLKRMSFQTSALSSDVINVMSPVKLAIDLNKYSKQSIELAKRELVSFLDHGLIGIKLTANYAEPLRLIELICERAPQLESLELDVVANYNSGESISMHCFCVEEIELMASKLPNLKSLGLRCSFAALRRIYKLSNLKKFFWVVPLDWGKVYPALAKTFHKFGPQLATLAIKTPDTPRFYLQAELIAACINLEELVLEEVKELNMNDVSVICGLRKLATLRIKKFGDYENHFGYLDRNRKILNKINVSWIAEIISTSQVRLID